ncbi:MAG: enoyl-CoA hydratase/isomerase family protein [Methylibium sp.]|uniref:oxepin-CoA hydrolase, alternative type n=1 Tax=Methylibium sp. TaxID=2067992 RepID=UPI0018235361|nr:enoyl-CoA hydratase family protein [Methylibium sp.]MBA3598480.1 enoyl-CoA hydratase/isomerase family protein [Methylibium sp.]
MTAQLLTQRHDATLILTISDPQARNALSPQVSAAAVEALSVAEADASVRAVVLAGDGAHFCAGGNLRRLAVNRATGSEAQEQHLRLFHQFIEALRTHPKPVIAAVEGAAAGGGFSLALACDLMVAAEDARFSMAYARVGLSPDGGGSWHLACFLPRALALELLWLGEAATARQLQTWGLVNRVTDSGEALSQALRMAEELAAFAPNALASAKELVNQARVRALGEHLAAESTHFVDNLFHANGAEGLQAFFEKRAPRFS